MTVSGCSTRTSMTAIDCQVACVCIRFLVHMFLIHGRCFVIVDFHDPVARVFLIQAQNAKCMASGVRCFFLDNGVRCFVSRVWHPVSVVLVSFMASGVRCFFSNTAYAVRCFCSSMASGAPVFAHEYGVRCFRFSRMAPSNMASGGRCLLFRVRCPVSRLFLEYGVRCPVLFLECRPVTGVVSRVCRLVSGVFSRSWRPVLLILEYDCVFFSRQWEVD